MWWLSPISASSPPLPSRMSTPSVPVKKDVLLVAADQVIVIRAARHRRLELAREVAGQLERVVARIAPAEHVVERRRPVRHARDERADIALRAVRGRLRARRDRGDRVIRRDHHDIAAALDREVVGPGRAHHDHADIDELARVIHRRVEVDRRHRRRRTRRRTVDRIRPVAAVHRLAAALDVIGERAADDLRDPEQRLLTAVAVRAATAFAAAVELDLHPRPVVDVAVDLELRLSRRQRGREADDVPAPAAVERVVAGVAAHEVVARSAVELVGAVATDQHVVALLAEQVIVEDVAEDHVVARAAPDPVAAAAPVDHVVARAAVDHVIARATVDVVVAVARADDVVAAEPEDLVGSGGAEDDVVARRADEAMRIVLVRVHVDLVLQRRIEARVLLRREAREHDVLRIDIADLARREQQEQAVAHVAAQVQRACPRQLRDHTRADPRMLSCVCGVISSPGRSRACRPPRAWCRACRAASCA